MSQCHKLKTTVKYLIMNRLADGHDDAVSRCIDEFFGFAPYGKGEPVYDHSHRVGAGTLGLTLQIRPSGDNPRRTATH